MNWKIFSGTPFKIFRLSLLLLALTLVGTIGFHWIEGWSLFDSLYMSVITLTTVGYSEIHPLSHQGRVFVIVYLISGISISLYLLASIGEMMLKIQLFNWLGERRKIIMIKNLKGHYIVCGFGRMGQTLCRQLKLQNIAVVAIEASDSEAARVEASNLDVHLIIGDATRDDILEKAHIETAYGVAAVIGNDAENLFVVLSARLYNPNLKIIARSTLESSVSKLHKAGADNVVSPYTAGAKKMAQLLTHPEVSEIFDWDKPQGSTNEVMEMAEIKIDEKSPNKGLKVHESEFYNKRGSMIVAIRRASGQFEFPPKSESELQSGDHLIVLGTKASIQKILS